MSTQQNRFGFVSDIIESVVPDDLEDAWDEVSNLGDIANPVFAPTTINPQQLAALSEILVSEALSSAQTLAQNGPTLIKEQVKTIVALGFEQALGALSITDIKKLEENLKQLYNGDFKNWTPSNLADGATSLTTTLMNEAYANAKIGYDIIKAIAEEVYERLLIRIAMLYIESVEDTLKSLITTITSVPAAWTKIKAGVASGDPVKVIEGLKDLLLGIPPSEQQLPSFKIWDAGSLVISVEAATAAGVEVNKSFGIAISLEAVSHMASNNGSISGFNGPVMSFISTAGMALFSAGTGTDVLIGYDVGQPDDLDGFGIDVNISLKAKLGGSVSVGLDPISSFPPDLNSVMVGIGGGASVEASIGASYSTVIAVYYPDGFQQGTRTTKDYLATRTTSHHFTPLPSTSFLQATSHPRQLWLRYKWVDLPAGAKAHWQTLGWGNDSTRAADDEPIPLTLFQTSWTQLSSDQQTAAGVLGFTQTTWDDAYPNGSYIRSLNPAPAVNDPRGFKSYVDEYWDQFTWAQLAKGEQRLWRTLGFNQNNFSERKLSPPTQSSSSIYKGKIPAIKYRKWSELTTRQQKAATYLGYSAGTWITLAPKADATHMSYLDFNLPDGSAFPSYQYISTPFHSYAIKANRYFILKESMLGSPGATQHSRWVKIADQRIALGKWDVSGDQSTTMTYQVKNYLARASMWISRANQGRIVALSFHKHHAEKGTYISFPLKIDTTATTATEIILDPGEYLNYAEIHEVPDSEKKNFGSRNPIGYLKIGTNNPAKTLEIGARRTAQGRGYARTPANIKIRSITAQYSDNSLNRLSFDYEFLFSSLPTKRTIGKAKGSFFVEPLIKDTSIEIFGDKVVDRIKVNGNKYGSGGSSRGSITLGEGEYIERVYAEYGGKRRFRTGLTGIGCFGYLEITTSKGQTVMGGMKATQGETGFDSATFDGPYFAIAGWSDNFPRELTFFK